VEVTEAADDDDLIRGVERGALELSFAIQPIPDGPFDLRELMSDPFVVVAAAGSALARSRPKAADLDRLPMVGYHHGKDHALAVAREIAREDAALLAKAAAPRSARSRRRAPARRPRHPASRPA